MTDSVQLQPPSTNGAEADSTRSRRPSGSRRVDAVVEHDGPDRARQLLRASSNAPSTPAPGRSRASTPPYVNTIPADREPPFPGDPLLERRLRSIVRWNAIAMVVRANKLSSELGGHIASYQSLATLYEVGYNHFWRASTDEQPRRSRLLPGPLIAGQLRARLPRRAAHRASSSTASARRCPSRAGCPRTRTRG